MKYFSAALVALILTGCQKFNIVNVTKENGNVVFSNEKIISTCTKSIYIYDFEVKYINSDGADTVWMLVRSTQPNPEHTSFDFPLIYGESVIDVNTTIEASTLKSGLYKLGATLSCLTTDGDKSITLIGIFAIDKDNNLITNQDEISRIESQI